MAKKGFLTPICFRKRWPSKVSKFQFFCTTLYILPYICKFFHIFSYSLFKNKLFRNTKKLKFFLQNRIFPPSVNPPPPLKDQSSKLQSYEKNDIFGKIMKNGAFFV